MKIDDYRDDLHLPYPALSQSWYVELGKQETSVVTTFAYGNLSKSWYQRRGELYRNNFNRKQLLLSDETDVKKISRKLEDLVKSESSESKKIELLAIHESIKYFIENGPITPFQEIIESYRTFKNDRTGNSFNKYMAPAAFLSRLSRYGAFKLTKVFGKSYAILSTNLNVEKLGSMLNSIPENVLSSKVNESVKGKVGGIFQTALKLASSKSDQDLIKGDFFFFFFFFTFVAKKKMTIPRKSPKSKNYKHIEIDFSLTVLIFLLI